jgi:hypothetical protein
VLSDCSCDRTLFTEDALGEDFQNVNLFEDQKLVTVINSDEIYIPLTFDYTTLKNSVSTVCGNRDGVTSCGNKELIVWDVE